MSFPIMLELHLFDAPRRVIPQPDGRRATEAVKSAVLVCDITRLRATASISSELQSLLPQLPAQSPAAQVSLEERPQWRPLADEVMTQSLYESIRCCSCERELKPGEIERVAYRQEHGSWGTNAGIEFYCTRRHRLYDFISEQTA